jgi:hypothetical protein
MGRLARSGHWQILNRFCYDGEPGVLRSAR